MKNKPKQKRIEEKKSISDYHKQAIKFILAILKAEKENLEQSNHGMTCNYKEGYFMGFSDAIETISDLKIINQKKK